MNYQRELISVIIPVYDTGSYLRRCLSSLSSQTYDDLEIIIIDDGSKDELTLSILAEYASKDKRIHVIHKENGGCSRAYNAGLDLAGGEYVMIVYSDDYLDKDAIEVLFQAMKEDDVDLVGASYYLDFDHFRFYRSKIKKEGIYTKPETLHGLCHNTGINNYAWAKLYKAELLKDIRFPIDHDNFSDMEFSALVFLKAEKVKILKRRLYHYYQRKASMTGLMSYKTAHDMFMKFKRQEDLLNKEYPEEHFSNYTNYYRSEMMILLAYLSADDVAKEDVYLPIYDDSRVWLLFKFFRAILSKIVAIKYHLKKIERR